MRKLIAVAVLGMCGMANARGVKPITRVPLPCESEYQRLSPRATQVAVQCKDHSLHLLNIPQGTEQRVFAADQGVNDYAFVFSPDGRWLAVGFDDGEVEVVQAAGSSPGKRWQADSRRIDTLRFLPDGNSIIVGRLNGPAQVWEISGTPTVLATLQSDFGGLTACDVSPDGKLLVTADGDTVIRWYDTATWQRVREFRGFKLETFGLAFTRDGKQVLAGGADPQITVLDSATAKAVRLLPPDAGVIYEIDVLNDGRRAVAVYGDAEGVKPPHEVMFSLQAGTATALRTDPPLSCGRVIRDKFWVCSAQGKSLNVYPYE